jgi:hypothetical protein
MLDLRFAGSVAHPESQIANPKSKIRSLAGPSIESAAGRTLHLPGLKQAQRFAGRLADAGLGIIGGLAEGRQD